MPPAGFEPAIPVSERSQTHALDRAATGIGTGRLRPKLVTFHKSNLIKQASQCINANLYRRLANKTYGRNEFLGCFSTGKNNPNFCQFPQFRRLVTALKILIDLNITLCANPTLNFIQIFVFWFGLVYINSHFKVINETSYMYRAYTKEWCGFKSE